MKRILLMFVLVLGLTLFISKEQKYSEMENFKMEAAVVKIKKHTKDQYKKDFSSRRITPGLRGRADKNF